MKDVCIPANPEAEEAVIGALLINPEATEPVSLIVQPGDFYRERNAWIFSAILTLRARGTTPDYLTIVDYLEAAGKLQEVGGASYLSKLIADTPSAVHAEHYAGIVARDALRRKIIGAASRIAALAQSDAVTDDLVAQATALVAGVTESKTNGETLTWAASFDAFAENQLQRDIDLRSRAPRLALPWASFKWVRPLRAGTLAAVAAFPGMGKTSFMETLAEHWARFGFQVAFFHFELSHEVMLDRRMARNSGEPLETIERGELSAKMQQADDRIRSWPGAVHYIHCSGWSMAQVVAAARNMTRRGMAQVVVVDYLQKARYGVNGNGLNTAQLRGQDVEVLKNLAEIEGLAVVVGSQFSREAQKETRKTGQNMRDTNELLDKANLVLTLDRPILTVGIEWNGYALKEGSHSPETTLRVDKQTMGETGDGKLLFVPGRFWFTEPQR